MNITTPLVTAAQELQAALDHYLEANRRLNAARLAVSVELAALAPAASGLDPGQTPDSPNLAVVELPRPDPGQPPALFLSVRTRKCLRDEGIHTLRDLLATTPEELLEIPDFGGTNLWEIRAKLRDLGLCLRGDVRWYREGKQ